MKEETHWWQFILCMFCNHYIFEEIATPFKLQSRTCEDNLWVIFDLLTSGFGFYDYRRLLIIIESFIEALGFLKNKFW